VCLFLVASLAGSIDAVRYDYDTGRSSSSTQQYSLLGDLSDFDKYYADEVYRPGGPKTSYGDKLDLNFNHGYSGYNEVPTHKRKDVYERLEPVKERQSTYPRSRSYSDDSYQAGKYEGVPEEEDTYMKYEAKKANSWENSYMKPNKQTKQYDSQRFFYGQPRLVKSPRQTFHSVRENVTPRAPAGFPVLFKHYETPQKHYNTPSLGHGFTAPPPPPDPCQHLDQGEYILDEEFASILPKADVRCNFVKCAHGKAFLNKCSQGTRNDKYGGGFCSLKDHEGVCGAKRTPKRSLSIHNRQSRKRLYSRKDPCIEKYEGQYVLEREFKTHFPYTDNMCYFVKCANKKAFLNPCGPGTRNNDDGSGFCSVLDLEGYCGRTIYDKKPKKEDRTPRNYRELSHRY